MTAPVNRTYRVGGTLTDLCRACKIVRDHTVMALDESGRAARVVCDYCRSEHNYRGGDAPSAGAPAPHPQIAAPLPRLHHDEAHHPAHTELAHLATTGARASELEGLLRRIVREELGLDDTAPAPKWRGGQLVLRPGKPGLQEKTLPIDALFHKVVMVRNRLRTLEQQLNGAELPDDVKLRLQSYVTGCYGSLTSFNILFADEADQFRGTGGE